VSEADYDDAAELAALAGVTLTGGQQKSLRDGMRTTGARWDAFRVTIPHRDPAVLLARELAGIFLLNERILHIALSYHAAAAAFYRVKNAVGDSTFQQRVKRITHAHGAESVELHSGARIQFGTRRHGRGFSCDCLIAEDADRFSDEDFRALLPALSAGPNPQIWCTWSAEL
jgi:hypothetical protein